MAVLGNWLLVKRLVTITLFKLVRAVFVFFQSIRWQLNGTAEKLRQSRLPENYDGCAHVLNVLACHKFCEAVNTSVDDFLCTHNGFVGPRYIIENDNISLVTINEHDAVFGETKSRGMHLWRSEYNSFIRLAQMDHCHRLIIVPLPAFHRLSETIGDPSAQIVFLFNTARCGSTLLTQLMEFTSRCVSVSEPDSPNIIAAKFRKDGCTSEIRQLARDVIRWECRPYPTIRPPPLAYILKVSALSVLALPLFKDLFPNAKCLFMYRDMLAVAKSMYRLSLALPSVRLSYLLGKHCTSIQRHIASSMGYSGPQATVRIEDNLTMGFLLNGITVAAYRDMRQLGFDVSALRYEDLVAHPLETLRVVLRHCGLPVELAERGVRGMELDSQRNSPVARSIIGKFKDPELTAESRQSLNKLLATFALPPIGEKIILEGTLSCGLNGAL